MSRRASASARGAEQRSPLDAVLRAGLAATGNRYDSTWGDLKRHSLQHARMKELGVPKEWYADRDYVIAAGRLPARGAGLGVFSHLSSRLQADKDVVIACIEGNPGVYFKILRVLQQDPDVCDAFIGSIFYALEETSDDYRADGWKKAVLHYISQNDRKWRDNSALVQAYTRARAPREQHFDGLSAWQKLKAAQTMKPRAR